MIKIRYLYEEANFKPLPGWVVAEKDRRLYQGSQFGLAGHPWATVVTAQLEEELPIVRSLTRYIPCLSAGEPSPLSTWLQLRVCSPVFKETDRRFLVNGKHMSLIQDEFDIEEVRVYIERRIQETAGLNLPAKYEAWQKYFHLYDPDDD